MPILWWFIGSAITALVFEWVWNSIFGSKDDIFGIPQSVWLVSFGIFVYYLFKKRR